MESPLPNAIAKPVCLSAYFPEDITIDDLEFAVVDMDGDGVPEVIVNFKGPDFGTILHYENGKVYGYPHSIKAHYEIKTDGSFNVAGGSNYSMVGKLQFSDGICYRINMASSWLHEPNYPKRKGSYTSYNIGGENVTEEEYNDYVAAQCEKEGVTWHDLTEDNISKLDTFIS